MYALIAKCRDQPGALSAVREASLPFERPPRAFMQLEKLLQDGSSALLLATGERAAEHERTCQEPPRGCGVASARGLRFSA